MIDYTDSGCPWSLLLQRRGSVIPSSLMSTTPSVAVALLLFFCGNSNLIDDFTTHFERVFSGEDIKASQLWAAMTGTVLFLIGFRTNKAYSRFWDGTTLLHQMWGEWFDAVSCLIAFSRSAKKKHLDAVANFRQTLVRLMSLCHASAMVEIAMDPNADRYPTLDINGLDQETIRYLKECKSDADLTFNRVEVLIHMIQTLIVDAHEIGVLPIPPPILSRVFQTISRGQVNLANCKKITTTLFPFPYAQLIAFLMALVSIITPLAMFSICGHTFWSVIFTLLPVFGLYALNDIARELEMPFGRDANDLPLHDFQMHMNSSLLMLIHKEADHVASITSACNTDIDFMKKNMMSSSRQSLLSFSDGDSSLKVVADATSEPVQVAAPEADPGPLPASPAPAASAAPLAPPAPPPPPAPAAPAQIESKALQKMVQDLSVKFDTLAANTLTLSDELHQNTAALSWFPQQSLQSLMQANSSPRDGQGRSSTPMRRSNVSPVWVGGIATRRTEPQSERPPIGPRAERRVNQISM